MANNDIQINRSGRQDTNVELPKEKLHLLELPIAPDQYTDAPQLVGLTTPEDAAKAAYRSFSPLQTFVPTEIATSSDFNAQKAWEDLNLPEFEPLFAATGLSPSFTERLLYSAALIRDVYAERYENIPPEIYTVSLKKWCELYQRDVHLQAQVQTRLDTATTQMQSLDQQVTRLHQEFPETREQVHRENLLLITFTQLVMGNTDDFCKHTENLARLDASLRWKKSAEQQKQCAKTIQDIQAELARLALAQREAGKTVLGYQEQTSSAVAIASDRWDFATANAQVTHAGWRLQKQQFLDELALYLEEFHQAQAEIFSAQATLLQLNGANDEEWQKFLWDVGQNPYAIPASLKDDVIAEQHRVARELPENTFERAYYEGHADQALTLALARYADAHKAFTIHFGSENWLTVVQQMDTDPLLAFQGQHQNEDVYRSHQTLIETVQNPMRNNGIYKAVFLGGEPTHWHNWRFVKVDENAGDADLVLLVEEWNRSGEVVATAPLEVEKSNRVFKSASDSLEKALAAQPELFALEEFSQEVLPDLIELQQGFVQAQSGNVNSTFVNDIHNKALKLIRWWEDNRDTAKALLEAADPTLRSLATYKPSPFDVGGYSQNLKQKVDYYLALEKLFKGDFTKICTGIMGRSYRKNELQDYQHDAELFATASQNPFVNLREFSQSSSLSPKEAVQNYSTTQAQWLDSLHIEQDWVRTAIQNFHHNPTFSTQALWAVELPAEQLSAHQDFVFRIRNSSADQKAVYLGGAPHLQSSWAFVRYDSEAQTWTFTRFDETQTQPEIYTLHKQKLDTPPEPSHDLENVIDSSQSLNALHAASSALFEKINGVYTKLDLLAQKPKDPHVRFDVMSAALDLQEFAEQHQGAWQALARDARSDLQTLSRVSVTLLDSSPAAKRCQDKIQYLELALTWMSDNTATSFCDELLGKQFYPAHPGPNGTGPSHSEILNNWWETEGVILFGAVSLSVVAMHPAFRMIQAIQWAGNAMQSYAGAQGCGLIAAEMLGATTEVMLVAGVNSAFQIPGVEFGKIYSGENYHTGFSAEFENVLNNDLSTYALFQSYASQWQHSFVTSSLIMGAGKALSAKSPQWKQSHNAHLRVLGETLDDIGAFADRASDYLPVNKTTREILSEFGQELLEDQAGDYGHIVALINSTNPNVNLGISQAKIEFDKATKTIEVTQKYSANKTPKEVLEFIEEQSEAAKKAGGITKKTVTSTPDRSFTVVTEFGNGFRLVNNVSPDLIPKECRELFEAAQTGSENIIYPEDLGVHYDPAFGMGALVLSKDHNVTELIAGLQRANFVIAEVNVADAHPHVVAILGDHQLVIHIEHLQDLANYEMSRLATQPGPEVDLPPTPGAVANLLGNPGVQAQMREAREQGRDFDVYTNPLNGRVYIVDTEQEAYDYDLFEGDVVNLETDYTRRHAEPHWVLLGRIVGHGGRVEPNAEDVRAMLIEDWPTHVVLHLNGNNEMTWSMIHRDGDDLDVEYWWTDFTPEGVWRDTVTAGRELASEHTAQTQVAVASIGDSDGPDSSAYVLNDYPTTAPRAEQKTDLFDEFDEARLQAIESEVDKLVDQFLTDAEAEDLAELIVRSQGKNVIAEIYREAFLRDILPKLQHAQGNGHAAQARALFSELCEYWNEEYLDEDPATTLFHSLGNELASVGLIVLPTGRLLTCAAAAYHFTQTEGLEAHETLGEPALLALAPYLESDLNALCARVLLDFDINAFALLLEYATHHPDHVLYPEYLQFVYRELLTQQNQQHEPVSQRFADCHRQEETTARLLNIRYEQSEILQSLRIIIVDDGSILTLEQIARGIVFNDNPTREILIYTYANTRIQTQIYHNILALKNDHKDEVALGLDRLRIAETLIEFNDTQFSTRLQRITNAPISPVGFTLAETDQGTNPQKIAEQGRRCLDFAATSGVRIQSLTTEEGGLWKMTELAQAHVTQLGPLASTEQDSIVNLSIRNNNGSTSLTATPHNFKVVLQASNSPEINTANPEAPYHILYNKEGEVVIYLVPEVRDRALLAGTFHNLAQDPQLWPPETAKAHAQRILTYEEFLQNHNQEFETSTAVRPTRLRRTPNIISLEEALAALALRPVGTVQESSSEEEEN